MILEQETYEKFGYYPSELSQRSGKKILATCDGCGKIRETTKHTYRDLCLNCANKKQGLKYKTGKNIRCSQCGKEIYIAPWDAKRVKNKFCSQECYSKWQSENRRGENSPTWKGGGKEYICQWCGKTFKVHGREKSRKYERKFCSRECYTEWQLKNMQGEKSWSWKGGGIKRTCKRCGNDFYVKRSTIKRGWGVFCSKKCAFPEKIRRTCKECNKEFYVAPNVIKHGGGVFCNRECYQKWQKKHMGGEESPAYLDGNSFEPYCPNFNEEFKERVREFFGRRCFECNKTEKENGRKLSVHHVNYDKMVCCNDVKPLFTALCDRHHTKTRWNREYWEERFTKRIMKEFGGKCYFTKEEMNEIEEANKMYIRTT